MTLGLPGYRWPSRHPLAVSVAQRCRLFLRRAGTVVLSLSIVLWAMAGGVSALARLDQRHPGRVGPGFQLFAGRCAEGIACRQHDPHRMLLE